MWKSRWIFLLAGLVLGFVACILLEGPRHAAQAAAAKDQARAMLMEQEEAWNRGDLGGFLKSYEMNDRITFYTDDRVSQGWVTISDRYQRRYGEGRAVMGKLTFSDLELTPLSDDSVMARGRWTTSENREPGTGLFTLLIRKTDAGWKIVHDHTSSKQPPKP